jgi:two-component system CheB/CheR fusion protein
LRKVVFPCILQGRPANAAIRIWVAGCATGEEAFSITISLQEYLNETGATFPVQIFASDISQSAIERARTSRYRENIKTDITHHRLTRFFTKIQGGVMRAQSVPSKVEAFTHPIGRRAGLARSRNKSDETQR